MTAAGRVTLNRRSLRCPDCGTAAHPADDRIGLDGFLSPQATRLACLAAASWSFDVASDRLEEIAGLRIDDETIRHHVHRAAIELGDRRRADPPRVAFAAADGDIEFLTDGVMAPTREGWREVKLARFQVWPAGDPAEPRAWADRELPGPAASVCYATTAESTVFSACWAPWAVALGIDPAGELTVLAAGAAWIWSAATQQFPAAEPVLAIFHASQHIAAATAGLHGEGTAEAADWREHGRAKLLADGWPGLLDHVGQTPAEGRLAAGQTAVDERLRYFAKHTERVGYFGRLKRGRSIGSGAVEGLARRMGRRLKVPGRGWSLENIDGMASLIATVDTPEWQRLWARPAA